jgi:putative MATE family efflux protein
LKTTISYNRVWQIAYPIIIGSIAQNVINVTDTAFLGRLGEVALGAGAIGGLFYLAIVMLGWGFGIGVQIVIARRFGEGAYRTIGRVAQHGFFFLTALALLLFIIYQSFGNRILSSLVESEAINVSSAGFLKYRIWGLFFAHTSFLFNAFYVGIGRTRIISLATVVMVALNIGLDYALIFGHFGLPQMGVEGAALASVISEGASVLVFIAFSLSRSSLKKYRIFTYRIFSFKLLFRLLKISVPTMFQSFFAFAVWFVFFLIIEKMGETELAISNVIRSIYVLLMVPIMGFASAANTLVSFVIGQGRSGEVLSLVKKVAALSVGMVMVLALFSSIFAPQLLSLYITSDTLVAMGVPIVYIISVAAIFLAAGSILFHGVSGTGKTNVSLIIESLVLILYVAITALLVLNFKVNLTMVWTVELFYGLFLAIVSYFYLKSNRWVGRKV